MDTYDFVVVGGGTAGSVLAARLSERSHLRVLLLEAGADQGPATMAVPAAWPSLIGSEVDWGFHTVPQTAMDGVTILYPRGKVLGGSSGINAMAHLRGHRSGYDAWEEQGGTGWNYDSLMSYFRRSEDTVGQDTTYRGVGGPTKVRTPAQMHPAARACLAAFVELGYPVSADLNGRDQEGACRYEITVVNGVRQSAADAYLRPVMDVRGNLTVMTDAKVKALTLSGNCCTGVRYLRGGEEHTVAATSEVVLCAGVIGSPHLLQLSGIGPADVLRAQGVEPLVDLPGVGANFCDHPLGVVVYSAAQDMPAGENNHFDVLAALRTDPALTAPDIHILFADVPLNPPGMEGPQNGFTVEFSALRPYSRGSVMLASRDPDAAPLIDPGFLADERDMATMLAGLRMAREIGGSKAMADWRGEEVLPGAVGGDGPDRQRDFLRRSVGTYFHGVGTCKMGTDEYAVVDPELRLHGVQGLRVADASVMPSIPGANTNATVLAIAERAADLIV